MRDRLINERLNCSVYRHSLTAALLKSGWITVSKGLS